VLLSGWQTPFTALAAVKGEAVRASLTAQAGAVVFGFLHLQIPFLKSSSPFGRFRFSFHSFNKF
jgi:hypothetical protein